MRPGGFTARTQLEIELKQNVFAIDATVIVIDFEADGFYIMDRAYEDFAHRYNITLSRAFFVTRALRNLDFRRSLYFSRGQGFDVTFAPLEIAQLYKHRMALYSTLTQR